MKNNVACKRDGNGELLEGSDTLPGVIGADIESEKQRWIEWFKSLPFPNDRWCSPTIISEDGVVKVKITMQLPHSPQCTTTILLSDGLPKAKQWLATHLRTYHDNLLKQAKKCASIIEVI